MKKQQTLPTFTNYKNDGIFTSARVTKDVEGVVISIK